MPNLYETRLYLFTVNRGGFRCRLDIHYETWLHSDGDVALLKDCPPLSSSFIAIAAMPRIGKGDRFSPLAETDIDPDMNDEKLCLGVLSGQNRASMSAVVLLLENNLQFSGLF